MLINPHFLPVPQLTVDTWKNNLRAANYTEEKIENMNLTVDYYVPKQLTKEITGLDDNTGLFDPKLSYAIHNILLPSGYQLIRFPQLIPVMVCEKMREEDYMTDEDGLNRNLLHDSYGFVLSISDFMSLIGNQLKAASRKFCVSFSLATYHDGIYRKNGRIYHKDHREISLKDGDKILSFLILELLDEGDYQNPSDLDFPLLNHVFRLGSYPEKIAASDKIRSKEFIESLELLTPA